MNYKHFTKTVLIFWQIQPLTINYFLCILPVDVTDERPTWVWSNIIEWNSFKFARAITLNSKSRICVSPGTKRNLDRSLYRLYYRYRKTKLAVTWLSWLRRALLRGPIYSEVCLCKTEYLEPKFCSLRSLLSCIGRANNPLLATPLRRFPVASSAFCRRLFLMRDSRVVLLMRGPALTFFPPAELEVTLDNKHGVGDAVWRGCCVAVFIWTGVVCSFQHVVPRVHISLCCLLLHWCISQSCHWAIEFDWQPLMLSYPQVSLLRFGCMVNHISADISPGASVTQPPRDRWLSVVVLCSTVPDQPLSVDIGKIAQKYGMQLLKVESQQVYINVL